MHPKYWFKFKSTHFKFEKKTITVILMCRAKSECGYCARYSGAKIANGSLRHLVSGYFFCYFFLRKNKYNNDMWKSNIIVRNSKIKNQITAQYEVLRYKYNYHCMLFPNKYASQLKHIIAECMMYWMRPLGTEKNRILRNYAGSQFMESQGWDIHTIYHDRSFFYFQNVKQWLK